MSGVFLLPVMRDFHAAVTDTRVVIVGIGTFQKPSAGCIRIMHTGTDAAGVGALAITVSPIVRVLSGETIAAGGAGESSGGAIVIRGDIMGADGTADFALVIVSPAGGELTALMGTRRFAGGTLAVGIERGSIAVVADYATAIALAEGSPAGDAVRGILMDALCFADIALPGDNLPPTIRMLACNAAAPAGVIIIPCIVDSAEFGSTEVNMAAISFADLTLAGRGIEIVGAEGPATVALAICKTLAIVGIPDMARAIALMAFFALMIAFRIRINNNIMLALFVTAGCRTPAFGVIDVGV